MPTDPKIIKSRIDSSERNESYNLGVLLVHRLLFRVGWVFKTDSVVMPALIDLLGGTAWLRGWLPLLLQLGNSLPQVFFVSWIRRTRLVKAPLAAFSLLMGAFLGLLVLIWLTRSTYPMALAMPLVFFLYLAFNACTGIYYLAFGVLQGKLIRSTWRGRLLMWSTFWGTALAVLGGVVCVGFFFRGETAALELFLGVSAVCFVVCGLLALASRESDETAEDHIDQPQFRPRQMLGLLRGDPNLRRVVWVTMLVYSGLLAFPHYQTIGTAIEGLSSNHLMFWVIAQQATCALVSIVVGRLADLRGNRVVLQWLVFCSAIPPSFAVLIASIEPRITIPIYWLVYVSLGVVPLIQLILINYTLEICNPRQHAPYLSIIVLSSTIPFLVSPVFGWLIDLVGFQMPFLALSCVVLLGGWMSLRLDEPRHESARSESSS